MAYSCWVLIDKTRLPSVAELAQAIDQSGFPLRIDTDWDWRTHSGWLPAVFSGRESGFEIYFESLTAEAARAARAAGFPTVDSAVVIETRDWDSLRSGAAMAACLVAAGGSCISEDENNYIGADAATAWARTQISEADRLEREAAERAAARESARTAGNADTLLEQWLDELAGQQVIKFMLINEKLCTYFENGGLLSGNVWKLRMADECFEAGRKRKLRDRIPEILGSNDPEDWDMDAYETLIAESEKIGKIDDRDREAAFSRLVPLAGKVEVLSARRQEPHAIELRMTGPGNPSIEYDGIGFLAEIRIHGPAGEICVSDEVRFV